MSGELEGLRVLTDKLDRLVIWYYAGLSVARFVPESLFLPFQVTDLPAWRASSTRDYQPVLFRGKR
jgi:hypothetical protein